MFARLGFRTTMYACPPGLVSARCRSARVFSFLSLVVQAEVLGCVLSSPLPHQTVGDRLIRELLRVLFPTVHCSVKLGSVGFCWG